MAKDMKFRAVLEDNVSGPLDAIAKKLEALNAKVAAVGTQQAQAVQSAGAKIAQEADKVAKAAADKTERWEKQRIQMQRSSIALEEGLSKKRLADKTRDADKSIQELNTKERIETKIRQQAAVAEASLVLDRFNRRIAIESVKHQQIMTGLVGFDVAQEQEVRRHQAVVSRIQMDQGNFSNTPFQQMLKNFGTLNARLMSVGPVIGGAAAQFGSVSKSAGAFGVVLQSLSAGPMGIATAAVGLLTLGVTSLISRYREAKKTAEDFDAAINPKKDLTSADKVAELIPIMDRYDAAMKKVRQTKSSMESISGAFAPSQDLAEAQKIQREFEAKTGRSVESFRQKYGTNIQGMVKEQEALLVTYEGTAESRINKMLEAGKSAAQSFLSVADPAVESAKSELKVMDAAAVKMRNLRNEAMKPGLKRTEAEIGGHQQDDIAALKTSAEYQKMTVQEREEGIRLIEQRYNRERQEARQKDLEDSAAASDKKIEILTQEMEVHNRNAEKKKENDKKELETKYAVADASITLAGNIGSLIGQTAGRNKEQAKLALRISEVVAIANTAEGVTKAYAQGGVLGFVTGAGVAVAGAAQIAAIEAQMGKFYTGGYTGSGNPRDVAGVVHKKEYVVDHQEVERQGGPAGVQRALAGGGGGFHHHGDVIIKADTYEGGKAAARGYRDEIVRMDTMIREGRRLGYAMGAR